MDYTDSLALTMAHLRQQGYTQDLNLPVTFPVLRECSFPTPWSSMPTRLNWKPACTCPSNKP
jgi:hypothetical protein